MDSITEFFRRAVGDALKAITSVWTNLSTPAIGEPDHFQTFGQGYSNNYYPAGPVAWLQTELHWLIGVVAVFGLLLAAGRMAWQRNGQPVTEALSGFVTLAVVTGCGVAAVTIATQAGDDFSKWIIGDAAHTKFAVNQVSDTVQFGSANSGLYLLLFLMVIISALAQIAMLIVRYAMLALLMGFLPLAAAASISPQGRVWFKKMLGWLVAFVLYKPVAACIYAFAFICLRSNQPLDQLTGYVLIAMGAVALPALMRFIVPMVAASSGGGGGGAALAGGVAAMGARMVASRGGGGGGGGGAAAGKAAGGKAAAAGGPIGAAVAVGKVGYDVAKSTTKKAAEQGTGENSDGGGHGSGGPQGAQGGQGPNGGPGPGRADLPPGSGPHGPPPKPDGAGGNGPGGSGDGDGPDGSKKGPQ